MRGSIGKGLAAAVLAVLAGGAGLSAAPAAQAAPSPFPSCDGHAPPKGRGDGLAISDSWVSPGDPDPAQIRDQALGVAGDEACTAALENPAL
ncbi:MAG: hypothetical protein JSR86_16360, partial [Proteobacteria bacterium]|nr:hypothetical protein [Pseudomonadota bacterium]